MAECFFLCYSRIWTLRQSCVIRDASHLLQLNLGMYFTNNRTCPVTEKYIPIFNCSKCDASLITQDYLKVHFLEQH